LFRLGKVVGVKEPGLALIIPVIDRLVRVSLRINSSQSSAACSSKTSSPWAYTLIAPTTRSGSSNGSDRALSTPNLPTRRPNRGYIFSPPNDPQRTVRRSSAAVMQGPS
jgi:hypothetical protein